jgi:hypothetical protein
MKLPSGSDIDKFMELRFKPGSWEQNGIPSEGCRVRPEIFERILSAGGNYDIDDLIHGLMDWLDVTDDPEPASQMLRMMLDYHYPPDGRATGKCRFQDENGVDQIFHVGSIDTASHVVSWQRREWVIALAQPLEEGRMVVGAPGPVSLSVAQSILGHSFLNFMNEPYDSFEGVRATSRRTGSYYSWETGSATPIDWEYGFGRTMRDGQLTGGGYELPRADTWLSSNQFAVMVAIGGGYMN